MRFILLALTALTLSNAALARPCPAGDIRVQMTLRTVTIDNDVHFIAGRRNRRDFRSFLVGCDMDLSARRFRQWRANRRLTNVLLLYPTAATPMAALLATARRSQLHQNLILEATFNDPEPVVSNHP